MMNSLRTLLRSKLAIAAALAVGIGGGLAVRHFTQDSCCRTGAACCYPGSPCCEGHVASR